MEDARSPGCAIRELGCAGWRLGVQSGHRRWRRHCRRRLSPGPQYVSLAAQHWSASNHFEPKRASLVYFHFCGRGRVRHITHLWCVWSSPAVSKPQHQAASGKGQLFDREFTVDQAKEFYEAIAPHYDQRNSGKLIARTHRVAARFIKELQTERSSLRVLDLGGGTGVHVASWFPKTLEPPGIMLTSHQQCINNFEIIRLIPFCLRTRQLILTTSTQSLAGWIMAIMMSCSSLLFFHRCRVFLTSEISPM